MVGDEPNEVVFKNSLFEEVHDKLNPIVSNEEFMKVEDLKDYNKKEFVEKSLIVKVLKICNKTVNEKDVTEILLGDQSFTTSLSLWSNQKDKKSLFGLNDVLKMKHFFVLEYPRNNSPKNIQFDTLRTKIEKVQDQDVLSQFEHVSLGNFEKVATGVVIQMTSSYFYKACRKCSRKKVKGEKMCR